jgi:hypothetical protein
MATNPIENVDVISRNASYSVSDVDFAKEDDCIFI